MDRILYLKYLFRQLETPAEQKSILSHILSQPELILHYMTIYYMHYLEKSHQVHPDVPSIIDQLIKFINIKKEKQQSNKQDQEQGKKKQDNVAIQITMNYLPKEMTQDIGSYLNEHDYISYARINRRQYQALTTDGYKFTHLHSYFLVNIRRLYIYKRACHSIQTLTIQTADIPELFRYMENNILFGTETFPNVSKLIINNNGQGGHADCFGKLSEHYRHQFILFQEILQKGRVPVQHLELMNFGTIMNDDRDLFLLIVFVNILNRFNHLRSLKLTNVYLDQNIFEMKLSITLWKDLHTLHVSFDTSLHYPTANTLALHNVIKRAHSGSINNLSTNFVCDTYLTKDILANLQKLEIFDTANLQGVDPPNVKTIILNTIQHECYTLKFFQQLFKFKSITKVHLKIERRDSWLIIAGLFLYSLRSISLNKTHFTLIVEVNIRVGGIDFKGSELYINEILDRLLHIKVPNIRLVFKHYTYDHGYIRTKITKYNNSYTMFQTIEYDTICTEFSTNLDNSTLPGWNN